MRRFILITMIVAVIGSVAVILCTKEVNPYIGMVNPEILLSSPQFIDGDTLQIFTTYSFSVLLNAAYKMHYCIVKIKHNRLWLKGDTVFTEDQLESNPFIIKMSSADTGWQTIQVQVLLNDGSVNTKIWDIRMRSPLAPTGYMRGDSMVLHTKPVGDMVSYIWTIGNRTVISGSADTTIRYRGSLPVNGRIQVSSGTSVSPSASFIVPGRTAEIPVEAVLHDTVFRKIADTIIDTVYHPETVTVTLVKNHHDTTYIIKRDTVKDTVWMSIFDLLKKESNDDETKPSKDTRRTKEKD